MQTALDEIDVHGDLFASSIEAAECDATDDPASIVPLAESWMDGEA